MISGGPQNPEMVTKKTWVKFLNFSKSIKVLTRYWRITWPNSRRNWKFRGLSSKLKAAFAQMVFVYWKKQLWNWAVVLAASWGKRTGFRNQFLPNCRVWKQLSPLRKGDPERKEPLPEPAGSAEDTFVKPPTPWWKRVKSFETLNYSCNYFFFRYNDQTPRKENIVNSNQQNKVDIRKRL